MVALGTALGITSALTAGGPEGRCHSFNARITRKAVTLSRQPPFVDVLPADRVAHETKTGHIRATDRIRTQIAKDKELVSRGDLAGAQWHFVASGKTDTIGADPDVFAWLDAAGIPFTIHVP